MLINVIGGLIYMMLLVVFVVVAAVVALEEEHMACLDQQHSEKEGQDVVVEDLSISDLDDSSNL